MRRTLHDHWIDLHREDMYASHYNWVQYKFGKWCVYDRGVCNHGCCMCERVYRFPHCDGVHGHRALRCIWMCRKHMHGTDHTCVQSHASDRVAHHAYVLDFRRAVWTWVRSEWHGSRLGVSVAQYTLRIDGMHSKRPPVPRGVVRRSGGGWPRRVRLFWGSYTTYCGQRVYSPVCEWVQKYGWHRKCDVHICKSNTDEYGHMYGAHVHTPDHRRLRIHRRVWYVSRARV